MTKILNILYVYTHTHMYTGAISLMDLYVEAAVTFPYAHIY